LPNIREILASNNRIASLENELQDMYCLDTLDLVGNPVVNQHPYIGRIQGDETMLQSALTRYFNGGVASEGSPV